MPASIWVGGNDGTMYKHNQNDSILLSWSAGGHTIEASGRDGAGCIWTVEITLETSPIFRHKASDGSIVSSFTFSPSRIWGLGTDANSSLWLTTNDFGGGPAYKTDQTGNIQKSFLTASVHAGLGVDSAGSLIIGIHDFQGCLIPYTTNGSTGSIIQTPGASEDKDIRGVGTESNDSIWHGTEGGSYYEINRGGQTLQGFNVGGTTTGGVTTTDEPLGSGGGTTSVTDNVAKENFLFNSLSSSTTGIGTVNAQKENFRYTTIEAEWSGLFWESKRDFDNAQSETNVNHPDGKVSLDSNSDKGQIINRVESFTYTSF